MKKIVSVLLAAIMIFSLAACAKGGGTETTSAAPAQTEAAKTENMFKGALSVRARDINDQMKLAAAYAIADLITDDDRSEENIIPGAFDPRVAQAARDTGVARL